MSDINKDLKEHAMLEEAIASAELAMPKDIDSWERKFFEKFGANTIWSKPSRENVETILDIHSFIRTLIASHTADRDAYKRLLIADIKDGYMFVKMPAKVENFEIFYREIPPLPL